MLCIPAVSTERRDRTVAGPGRSRGRRQCERCWLRSPPLAACSLRPPNVVSTERAPWTDAEHRSRRRPDSVVGGTDAKGQAMTDRGNSTHGPELDDQLAHEAQSIVQGHGSNAHVEEFRQSEPVPDDTDDAETVTASGTTASSRVRCRTMPPTRPRTGPAPMPSSRPRPTRRASADGPDHPRDQRPAARGRPGAPDTGHLDVGLRRCVGQPRGPTAHRRAAAPDRVGRARRAGLLGACRADHRGGARRTARCPRTGRPVRARPRRRTRAQRGAPRAPARAGVRRHRRRPRPAAPARTRPFDLPFLVVTVGREGGGFRSYRLGHAPTGAAEDEQRVQGRTDTLHKAKSGAG